MTAMRGNLLGFAHVKGLGSCRVYNNVNSKDSFFAEHVKSNTTRLVQRPAIRWRKASSHPR